MFFFQGWNQKSNAQGGKKKKYICSFLSLSPFFWFRANQLSISNTHGVELCSHFSSSRPWAIAHTHTYKKYISKSKQTLRYHSWLIFHLITRIPWLLKSRTNFLPCEDRNNCGVDSFPILRIAFHLQGECCWGCFWPIRTCPPPGHRSKPSDWGSHPTLACRKHGFVTPEAKGYGYFGLIPSTFACKDLIP